MREADTAAESEADSAATSLETIPDVEDALFSARGIETGYGDLQVLYGVDVDVRAVRA